MKETQPFYGTEAWKRCRDAYRRKRGGLCERCLAQGRFVPGEIVHHKIHLDPINMRDPEVALNFDNLELLCRACHQKEHEDGNRQHWIKKKRKKQRYVITDSGQVITQASPPM